MMPCRHATELVSASRDRDLTIRERLMLLLHLALCLPCRRFRRQVSELGASAKATDEQFTSDTPLTDEARARIGEAITEFGRRTNG